MQDILDAANHTNVIDSPGLLSRNHQLFLGLVNGQVQTPEQIGDIVIKDVNDVPGAASATWGLWRLRLAPDYTVVTANGKPAVLISINRQPDSNTVEVADEVHQEIENLRSVDSGGRATERVLRPVEHRAGVDWQRARRDHHRTVSRRASSSGCSCAIWAPPS